jgi:AraC family transcriptional regulator, regulatory protein of adaptative response / DNA-3-methyladenine glycosylase II
MGSMTLTERNRADDARYLAMQARDARFDGNFFTGVTSTGIYCRPVCRVRTPRRENCQFFDHAAQAESAGFRPCLRCRPELAPNKPIWSTQDASAMLAQQAARLLDEPDTWSDMAPTLATSCASLPPEGAHFALGRPGGKTGLIANLAARLGVSERHVRRIFEAQFGVSPLQYLQTRRLLTAKQLLTDTDLPVAQIALGSGFASVRRFNAAFVQHYGLNPTRLRLEGSSPSAAGIAIKLGYRPPYDVPATLGFYARRSLDAIEFISDEEGTLQFGKTLRLEAGATVHAGWLLAEFDVARNYLALRVSDSLREVLPLLIRRVRAAFDLDADPLAINQVLHGSFPHGDGLRVPGALDGFELAVRAVLGQQIAVAAARTLAQRLVNRYGESLQTPWPQLNRLFPSAAVLAQALPDDLGALGIVKQRQAAIVALARAVTDKRLQLHGGADVQASIAALKELPGIGDWTAQYIAMRALRWPDAFPAGDVALHKALGVQEARQPAVEALAASERWKPWRSYAVIRAWASLPDPVKKKSSSRVATKSIAPRIISEKLTGKSP